MEKEKALDTSAAVAEHDWQTSTLLGKAGA